MRAYLRHIHIAHWGYPRTKGRTTFHSLKECTDLRTLSFYHSNVCSERAPYYYPQVSPQIFAMQASTMLKVLQRAHRASKTGVNILDIVKVEWERCSGCKSHEPDFAQGDDCTNGPPRWLMNIGGRCFTKCEDAAAHCEEIEQKIRGLIAKQLGIEE